MNKLKIAKERIYGIITGHPMVVTFCLGVASAALISTAIGIADPQHAKAYIYFFDNGDGGSHP